tara:strand:- start:207 stop:635 length:429 start_codon:yes stop_codon:yes gene_type:complete
MYNIEKIIKFKERSLEISNLLSYLSLTNIDSKDIENFCLTKPDNHNTYICIDIEKDKLVGIITIFIERKLIHNIGKVAHIEDLVVHPEYRKNGISKLLINRCIQDAKKEQCYKIILNCSENLIKFYEKNNFYKSGFQMRVNL